MALNKLILLVTLLLVASAWAQDDGEGREAASCSLFVKAAVLPADSLDRYGSAKVEATLCDKQGIPIPDQEIRLTATRGIFFCPPDTTGSAEYTSCYISDRYGRISVMLTNIPFNTQGRVLGSCTYKGLTVKASSTFSIKRNIIKNKKKVAKTIPSTSPAVP